MEPQDEVKERAKELFVNEKQIIDRLGKIIDLTKGKIQIYEESGKPFLTNPEKYSNKEKIFLIIIGIFISNQAGISDSSSVSLTSISQILEGIPNTTLSAPMKNLVDDRIVLRTNNGYELNKHNYMQIISMLEELDK